MPSPPSQPPARGPSLRIIAINDVYTLENLPRLKSLVRQKREVEPADCLLVTLAGDFVAPSLLSGIDHGRGMVDCMNAVGVTHVTFGNHEDDIPPEELRRRVREFRGCWLNTNVVGFEPPLPSHQIVEIGPAERRVRVGLLGVVMHDPMIYRRMPFGAKDVTPANEAARAMAARLLGEGRCQCVVPLTHQPAGDDRALALAQRSPRFPVIVGGHEHEVMVEQIDGTWVVKAGSDAVHAAVIDLVWPAEAPASGDDLPRVTVQLLDVKDFAEDEALRARVDAHMALVKQIEAATLVHLHPGDALSSIGARMRQTSMGTLICSRLRDALGADACLVNGGGIRASREYAERLTYGDIKAEMPFDNEIVVVRMPGRVVREAVAESRARAPVESGGFLQIDDRAQVSEPGNVLATLAGEPLDPEREYCVAVVRELLLGLDHIEPLVRFGREHPEKIPPPGSGREVKVVLVDAFSVMLWHELGGLEAIDTNHDGYADEDEVRAAMARAGREPPSPIVAGLVIRALDTDHDQRISREEAAAARPKPPAG